MNLSRKEALNLSTTAYDLGADVLRGLLKRAAQDGSWTLGDIDLEAWLERYVDQELVIIMAPVGPQSEETRTCSTCGTEYVGNQCPHCREIRLRLRGNE
jgi:hypothetical protein